MIKLSAFFQIIIGTSMIVVWILLYATGQIPELKTEPVRIAAHIIAESVTGIMLLISGLWIVIKRQKHTLFYNVSFGALIYTLIASPGYYAQKGEWGACIVFMLMLAVAVGLLVGTNRKQS